MKYKIKSRQFCSLSREPKWQDWLRKNAVDLYDKLIAHLKTSKGCRANVDKMTEIQKELDKRHLLVDMVKFLKVEYPIVLEEVYDDKPQPKMTKIESHNDKAVFKHYNPNLLTFPQKVIMTGDPNEIQRAVKEFIAGKISTDYLIIGNTAYVEYFHQKYEKESTMVKPESRELFKYRQIHHLKPDDKKI
jgi:hypothetical protein